MSAGESDGSQPNAPLALADCRMRLRHVRWLGGGSGAGKTTIARQLAADYGLRLYCTDDTLGDHARRAHPADTPLLQRFLAMDMDERWARRSPTEMLHTFPWYAGEGFALIVEDLLALPAGPAILVEGFRLLPRLVAPLLSHPHQAVWLAPTAAFRRIAFEQRGFTWEIPGKTSQPERALANLLARDHLFTAALAEEATALRLHIVETDGALSVAEATAQVAHLLALWPSVASVNDETRPAYHTPLSAPAQYKSPPFVAIGYRKVTPTCQRLPTSPLAAYNGWRERARAGKALRSRSRRSALRRSLSVDAQDRTTDAATAAPSYTRLVRSLPDTAPFVGPEALQRASGRVFTLRLGANESAFGPSPRAQDAMRAAVAQIAWYADPEGFDLRQAIARHAGVSIKHVGLGAGIDDLLGQVTRLFLEPGAQVVASLGSYPTFAFHVSGFGGSLERPPYRDDRNDLDALAVAAQRTQASLVYLANPDNPSGSWLTGDEVVSFYEALPPQTVLLLDEAYMEFAPAEAQVPFEADDPRVVRLRTFSKAFGMAGARIGYLIAAPATIRALDKVRLHFGVNGVAQAGAQAALADADYLAEVVAEVARGRAEYAALAAELGLTALPSATNFVTVDVGRVERARATVAALAERGVFIRMPGAPPLDRCIRITVGTAAERTAFAHIMREVWPTVR